MTQTDKAHIAKLKEHLNNASGYQRKTLLFALTQQLVIEIGDGHISRQTVNDLYWHAHKLTNR